MADRVDRVRGPGPRTPAQECVAILDFGSQYAQLIARRVREARVYCELLPHNTELADLDTSTLSGVILSGGPASV